MRDRLIGRRGYRFSMKGMAPLVVLAALLVVLVACGEAATPTPASTPTSNATPTPAPTPGGVLRTVPAPIQRIDIEVLGAQSEQSTMVVVSGLPNTCHTFDRASLSRDGDTFHLEVTNFQQVGADINCAEIFTTLSNRIPISGSIEACVTYDVFANGESRRVQATSPNIDCVDPNSPGVVTRPGELVVRAQISGACVPPAPLGVVVGETWTLSGPVSISGNVPPGSLPASFPADTAMVSYHVVITSIEDGEWLIDDGEELVRVEHSLVGATTTEKMLDASGAVINSETSAGDRPTISAPHLGPVLTLDWDCHREAWVEANRAGSEDGATRLSVGESTLSSGLRVVLFTGESSLVEPSRDLEGTIIITNGYDMLTGRLALREVHASGTLDDQPFSFRGEQQLEVDGQSQLPEWLLELVAGLVEGTEEDPPTFIAQYEYKGDIVYYIRPSCCDRFTDLFDATGNLIGHPDGGITGQGDGSVTDFFQERANERVIWAQGQTSPKPREGLKPAPIDGLEIDVTEGFPREYALVIRSGLPNSCVTFGDYAMVRGGTFGEAIRVEVNNLVPTDPDIVCAQVYGTVETRVPLGSDFDIGLTYTVDVNDMRLTFTDGRSSVPPVPGSCDGCTYIATSPLRVESVAVESDELAGGSPFRYNLVVETVLPDSCVTSGGHLLVQVNENIRVEEAAWELIGAELSCSGVERRSKTTIPLADGIQACDPFTVVAGGETHQVVAISPRVRCADPDGGIPTGDPGAQLLTMDDVGRFLTEKADLTVNFREHDVSVGTDDPDTIDRFYQITFETEDRAKGLTLGVLEFDVPASAESHYQLLVSSTDDHEIIDIDPPIGESSAGFELNAEGLGSVLWFWQGNILITLHTANSGDDSPLVSFEGLQGLARVVEGRL